MNTITIVGNLTRSPELKPVGDKSVVCKVAVIENRRKQVDGQWIDAPPNVFWVELWDRHARNLAAQASKGTRVHVTGSIVTDEWTDVESGEVRSRQVIKAKTVSLSLDFTESKHVTEVPVPSEEPAPF